jgi:hypothetical protein
MATFSTPTDDFVVWSDGWDNGILSYLKPGPRGRNVWKLTDGTFTENQPAYMSQISKAYYGGHIYPLTATEEAELTSAGYGEYITQ